MKKNLTHNINNISIINGNSIDEDKIKFASIASICFNFVILLIATIIFLFFMLNMFYDFVDIGNFIYIIPVILSTFISIQITRNFKSFMKIFKNKRRELYFSFVLIFGFIINVLMILTIIYVVIFKILGNGLIFNLNYNNYVENSDSKVAYVLAEVVIHFYIPTCIFIAIVIIYLIFLYIPFSFVLYKKYTASIKDKKSNDEPIVAINGNVYNYSQFTNSSKLTSNISISNALTDYFNNINNQNALINYLIKKNYILYNNAEWIYNTNLYSAWNIALTSGVRSFVSTNPDISYNGILGSYLNISSILINNVSYNSSTNLTFNISYLGAYTNSNVTISVTILNNHANSNISNT